MAENQDNTIQAQADGDKGECQLVPVTESIKYRRRAQKAEGRIQEVEQQLEEIQSQLTARGEQLAEAEAQRDEVASRLVETENRMAAERLMATAVTDLETAMLLLSKRVDLTQELDNEALAGAVEELLVDKPFLLGRSSASLPGVSASVRPSDPGGFGALAEAAERAIESGDRRDVAEYLRLRRQSSFGYL